MLTPVGRHIRAALTALVIALAVGGTVYGQDDHFPFAPFRMFSTRTPPDSHVSVAQIRGQVAGDDGEAVLSMASFGLRRAEVEGQLARLSEPGMLGELVRSREAVRADLPRLERLRLVQVRYVLRERRPVGLTETTLAEWQR